MTTETTPQGVVPCLEATIWKLKPFDLAVSQRLVISMPKDNETGQFKARITLTADFRHAGVVASSQSNFHWNRAAPLPALAGGGRRRTGGNV